MIFFTPSLAIVLFSTLSLTTSQAPKYTKSVTIVTQSAAAKVTAHYTSDFGNSGKKVTRRMARRSTYTFPEKTEYGSEEYAEGDAKYALPISRISGTVGRKRFNVKMSRFNRGIHDNLRFSLSNKGTLRLLSRD
jgi:hypothetical protein